MNAKRTIIFYCDNFGMGGTETLILRLMKWFSEQHCRTILLTQNMITNSAIISDIKNIDFEYFLYEKAKSNFFNISGDMLSFKDAENPLIITQFFPEYFKAFLLLTKGKYHINFTHTIYIVHPHSTYLASRKILFLGRWMVKMMLKNKTLIFMDEVCVKTFTSFYLLKESNTNYKILRLPIFIDKDYSTLTSAKNDVFNILTIARFEFPFKGYVIGLIKSFHKLRIDNKNISLTIIGYGDGRDEVNLEVNKLGETYSDSIHVLDQVPYSEINSYIEKCDVYVGMGTTILDAANKNKIVISAVAYQMSNYSSGFFHNNFRSIGEIFDANSHLLTFDVLIQDVINSSPSEFLLMANNSKDVLIENYNIDEIATQLASYSNPISNKLQFRVNWVMSYLTLIITWMTNKFKFK
ncbi:glycosyltransferase [Pedobacter jeongneungensis]|uniref:glycosyltransferase n=1 Tax=Pedobacter jeongneungensis TaxID=947309 RepID=UPI00046883AE|nr:glycosyltransferase [Pedobacter jeongneungensis]